MKGSPRTTMHTQTSVPCTIQMQTQPQIMAMMAMTSGILVRVLHHTSSSSSSR